jgi:trimethylamine:corrinoid methyltransferase-like protein
MRAIKKAEKIIEKDITKPFARVLSQLIVSLESEDVFHIRQLYDLPPEEFNLAIEVMKEWRIDRHYMGKSKTFAAAYYASALTQ